MGELDDFLSESDGGSWENNRLDNWRKRRPPEIYTWMHTTQLPKSVWRHSFPRVTMWKDKKTGRSRKAIFGQQFVSHEPEEILKAQFFRDRETGLRQKPPTRCPFSIFLQWIQDGIDAGEIPWTQPLFRFEVQNENDDGELESDVRVIHAGGIVGMFGKKDMSEDEKSELRRAGIVLRVKDKPWEGAWAQNATAKQSFVFPIVDEDAPGKGIQIATESKLLRQAVAGVIEAYREDLRDPKLKRLISEAFDPFKHPYCIKWSYDGQAKSFNDTYTAVKVGTVELTPEVEELIRGPKPDISQEIAPLNLKSLRSIFEAHCVMDGIPWDEFFKAFPLGEQSQQLPAGAGRRTHEVGAHRDEAPPTPNNAGTLPTPTAPPSPPPPVDEQTCPECGIDNDCPHVACDSCEKPILPSDAICKHCQFVFTAVEAVPVDPVKKTVPPPKQETASFDGGVGFGGADNDDEIPF